MDVSFIIPVFNHLDLTLDCISSLQQTASSIEYEIILVNDGSDEEATHGLNELANDRIRVIENRTNQGFAHSNNIGAVHARGETLILANNDLIFLPGWLEPMLAAFKKVPKLGLVGNIQTSVATGEIDHAGTYTSPKGSIVHKKSENRNLIGQPAYTRFHSVTGACCAIKRSLYLEIGGFDEAFVNGGEDVDLCFRLSKNGYKIAVANRSIVQHHVSATRKKSSDNDERNSRLLQRKWSARLAHQAASLWPDRYLAEAKTIPHPRALDAKLLKDALLRFLCLKKGPAPAALHNAYCEQERNERHWKARLDHWTDEMIKQEERNAHASPLKDRYEYEGLYTHWTDRPGVWMREKATISLPRGTLISSISITGKIADSNVPWAAGKLGLAIKVNDAAVNTHYPIKPGEFSLDFDNAPARAQDSTHIEIKLLGVEKSNTKAYLGRKLAGVSIIPSRIRKHFARYRDQELNKRLSIHSIRINDEDVYNFAKDATNPLNTEYAVKHAQLGINLVGWFKAELGIGESVRLAAKALDFSDIPHTFVPLKVNCLASQGDQTYAGQLFPENPYPINIFHIDAPQSPDIDHHHGKAFREGRYNIAYWAWELPDFPDEWTQHIRYFNEIWTPSNFVREAISIKSPVPVITVPHCIDFSIPDRDYRQELGLPSDKFLFSFAYDLNSYQERKNPKAAIEAFREAFMGSDRANDVGLVIKIHSANNNKAAYQELQTLLKGLPNCYLIDRTLSRDMTYGLMAACDSYVSLHRSEGFGLTVAESMFLEKPVISTNWSATSEFVNASNGYPVAFKLTQLTQNHGPYKKGQLWADPDPLDAAKHMQTLVANPDRAAELGKQAKQTIVELYSPDRISNIYRKRLRSIALW
ncbi:glycosyl transferase, group 2 family protein [Verrucomicrobiia bacterium DG1235]|nr:glycosyl transferase, group 2 family protein [Verrucomicrobiae bacterium DG1235]